MKRQSSRFKQQQRSSRDAVASLLFLRAPGGARWPSGSGEVTKISDLSSPDQTFLENTNRTGICLPFFMQLRAESKLGSGDRAFVGFLSAKFWVK